MDGDEGGGAAVVTLLEDLKRVGREVCLGDLAVEKCGEGRVLDLVYTASDGEGLGVLPSVDRGIKTALSVVW